MSRLEESSAKRPLIWADNEHALTSSHRSADFNEYTTLRLALEGDEQHDVGPAGVGDVRAGADQRPKWLQFLHEMVPHATSLALLINPTSPNLAEAQSRALEAAARSRGLQLHVLKASTEQDFDIAFASVAQLGASGLVISSDSFFFSQSAQLARLAIRHAIPTIFGFREFVAAGGLMSYGGSLTESFRWVGVYTGRVLKDEKLANLPVQQSTKIELLINLKTAEALGLELPATLLTRADDIIE